MLNGHQSNARKVITNFRVFRYCMAQMIDTQTGKNIIPFARELAMEPYKECQADAMESSIGLVVHLSFARACSEVMRIKSHGPSKSTIYRWFMDFSRAYGR